MTKFILGFTDNNIESLATSLIQLLGIKLYKQTSPMIGTWFSSNDIQGLIAAMRRNEPIVAEMPAVQYELLANDIEPGYTSPTFPQGGNYLLYIKTNNRDLFSTLLTILQNSTLQFQILPREEKGIGGQGSGIRGRGRRD